MRLVTTLALALLLGPPVVAQDLTVRENQTAPAWGPGAWLGTERPLQPSDLRGRVAYVMESPHADERAGADLAATDLSMPVMATGDGAAYAVWHDDRDASWAIYMNTARP